MLRSDEVESRSPLLHPLVLGALALLVVNDHVLKAAWPGLVTGKASDVAALVLVPPLSVEMAGLLARRRLSGRARAAVAAGAAVLIAATFLAVKLHPVANEAYAVVVGLIQWPAVLVGGLVAGAPIAPPGRAPTVLDAGDLIALPAAAIGWWVAAGGRWRRAPRVHAGTRVQAVGRIGILLGALFALAATSQSPPMQATGVAPDEVLLGSDQPSVERHAIVTISNVTTTGSIVIEARSRWPFVAPAPRFAVSREGAEPNGAAASNQVSVDPATCRSGCDVPVVVVIAWPGSTDARTSVAWEVVATVRAGAGEYLPYGDIVRVEGEQFASRWHGFEVLVWLPLFVVLAALAVAGTGRLVPIERRGATTRGDVLVLIASAALAAGLLISTIALPAPALEPGAGGAAGAIQGIWLSAGIAVAVGTYRWWNGSGALLATTIVTLSFIGLPFIARLVAEASVTFAGRGLIALATLTILAAIALVGALRRPGQVVGGPIPPSYIFVAAVAIATAVALFVTSGLDKSASGIAPFLALIHLVALGTWWAGSRKLLGLTSFVIAAGTALRMMIGPMLFGPPWTGWDLLMIFGVGWGAILTLVAALSGVGPQQSEPVAVAFDGPNPRA